MTRIARITAIGFLLVGISLHAYFQVSAGHRFTAAGLFLLPLLAFYYLAPAVASFFTRNLALLGVLVLTQIGFLAFDVWHATDWSSRDKGAAIGNAFLLIRANCISITISLTVWLYDLARRFDAANA